MGPRKRTGIDKGQAGELNFQELVVAMIRAGVIIDYKKPTYTNETDDGLDFELKAPHNIGDRMERLKQGEKMPPASNRPIYVRVDVKNPENRPIGKPVADKFVEDIAKNPKASEHWLAGGNRLTGPAKEVLDNAPAPCRYYAQDDMNRIARTLSGILEEENGIDA